MFVFVIYGTHEVPVDSHTCLTACPQCRQRQAFSVQRIRRYATLFFVPLFPLSDRYVAGCPGCQTTYEWFTQTSCARCRGVSFLETLHRQRGKCWNCGVRLSHDPTIVPQDMAVDVLPASTAPATGIGQEAEAGEPPPGPQAAPVQLTHRAGEAIRFVGPRPPGRPQTAPVQLRRWLAIGGGLLAVSILMGGCLLYWLYATFLERIQAAPRYRFSTYREANASPAWMVLFHSSDPAIWNRDVDRGAEDFALALANAPDTIRYLRLRHGKEYVIIPITKAGLRTGSADGRYHWIGDGESTSAVRSLGILDSEARAGPGQIVLGGEPPSSGWGFGHPLSAPNAQGRCWNGQTLPTAVFEIAVQVGELSAAEQRKLLR
jgi:hypothetical protein